MSLREAVFGQGWIYNWLRPLTLGGFDFSAAYEWLECGPEDVVLDIGCGFGYSLPRLGKFGAYYGFDTSKRAIAALQKNYGSDPRIQVEARECRADDVAAIRPTKVILFGILHHLSDAQAAEILGWLAALPTPPSVVTEDPVYRKGYWLNNLLCWLDRGRFVRHQEAYLQMVQGAGWRANWQHLCRSGNGWAHYLLMGLEVEPKV